jgi:hypothetical protein
MTTKKWKPINTTLVVNNIKNIIKTGDISKLKKSTYQFLYIMSGFIAHYDINGFKYHYENVSDLVKDLKDSRDIKYCDYYYEAFFQKDDYSRDYYTSKSKTLKSLADYLETIN